MADKHSPETSFYSNLDPTPFTFFSSTLDTSSSSLNYINPPPSPTSQGTRALKRAFINEIKRLSGKRDEHFLELTGIEPDLASKIRERSRQPI